MKDITDLKNKLLEIGISEENVELFILALQNSTKDHIEFKMYSVFTDDELDAFYQMVDDKDLDEIQEFEALGEYFFDKTKKTVEEEIGEYLELVVEKLNQSLKTIKGIFQKNVKEDGKYDFEEIIAHLGVFEDMQVNSIVTALTT